MKIAVVGAGYVGLVTAACLAELGNDVVCVDRDHGRVAMLQAGGVPIFEPGLDDVLQRNRHAGRLHFTTTMANAVSHGEVVFIAVGTPPQEDGSADLQHVLAVADQIGRHMNGFKVVINKSTVPVGTADRVAQVLRECIDDMKLAIDSLEPVQTDLLLLLATLRFRLAPRLQGSGLALEWAVDDVPRLEWLEPRSALHILRIFQEVLTNIVKHAHASRILVRTSHDATHVTVTVEDNGTGFEPAGPPVKGAARQRGKGLGNLLHRAAQLQGQARWERLPQGTRFSLLLPLERQPG